MMWQRFITCKSPALFRASSLCYPSFSSLNSTHPPYFNKTHTMAPTTFKLNTGQEIPAVGLGTWQSPAGQVEKAVTYALKDGYKMIDCAYCYGNEEEVGAGLKAAFEAGVKREDIFVVTKVWATYNTRPEQGLDRSLKALGLDYVDLFLVHWPLLLNPDGNDDKFPKKADGSRDVIRDYNHVDGWKLMEKLPATGKTRGVGVCNYSKKYLEELLPHATIIPAVNQIENHPELPQQEIVDFCKEKGIHIEAYSPLGSTGGPVMTAAPVVKIAEKRGVSASTVLLSYHVARGSTVLAKSVTPERITANKTIIDLDDEDVKALNDYSAELQNKGELKRYVYPPFGIDFGFPDKS
ncbi:Alcohol dehydrogenase [Fusarium acuminatum]|uniref:Alcohol dehydrogenase n=1 Tax=Fusarium acuminatum TaxID=5515 RepID=A0ABZ2X6F0_9HYPO